MASEAKISPAMAQRSAGFAAAARIASASPWPVTMATRAAMACRMIVAIVAKTSAQSSA